MDKAKSDSESIRQGHAQNRQQGLPPPGNPPFGYKRGKDKYLIDRANASIVKEFFEQFLLYGSLRSAVRYIAQKFNKTIAASTGRHWLTNPVYRGDLAYQAVQPPLIIRDTHKSIISRDEAAQVDRLLRRNKTLPSRTVSAPRSLAGLVTCKICQNKLIVTSVTTKYQSKSYLYLRCLDCPSLPKCKALSYEEILNQVINKICTELPKAVSNTDISRLANIKQQIETAISDKQKIIEQLPALRSQEILDVETFDLRLYNLRTEISRLETQKSQLPPINLPAIAQAVSIPQFWLDLSESERRFYFREFIHMVKVDVPNPKISLELIFVF